MATDIDNLYFFNNQYNDKIIWNNMISCRKKNFYQCLKAQESTQGFIKVYGHMTDFEIDVEVNRRLNIAEDSYTKFIEHSIVPYYTKKRFLDKYGYNVPISIKNIFEDHQIFNYMVMCQIDEEFFFGLEIAEYQDGCYLIIRQDRNIGLPSDIINTKITKNSKWVLFFQNQVDVSYAYKNKFLIFTNVTDADSYYLPMSAFTQITDFNKPDSRNMWTLYVTSNVNSEHLMVSTNASIIVKNGNEFIKIPKSFANYIISRMTNCKCYLMNQYQKANGFLYKLSDSSTPIFQINYGENPIPPSNFYVYGYDSVNQMKTALIDYQCTLSYPNIYRFEFNTVGMAAVPTHVYIEWFESSLAQTQFDNNMQDLLNLYKDDFPRKYYANEFTPAVRNYQPTQLTLYDFREFMASPEYPDLRSYRLRCLTELLKENPYRYKNLSKAINSYNQKTIRKVYQQSKYPSIFSRSVLNNSDEIEDDNELFTFDEPMMYLTVHTSKKIKPSAIIFVNGVRVNTSRIHSVKNDSYIYFSRSYLKTGVDNLVELEVFLYDSTPNHKIETDMAFFSTNVSTIFPDAEWFDNMTLSNLLFYDKKSSTYLRPEEITYKYNMNIMSVSNPSGESMDFIFDSDDLDFFMTAQSEFFIDEGNTYLMVRKKSTLIDCPSSSHKILNMSKLFLVLKSAHRLTQLIGVTNTNNYRKIYAKDALLNTVFNMVNFRENNDMDRFRVYYGGELLRSTEYSITPPAKYGDTVSVTIENILAIDNNREVIFEYLPIDETIIYDAIPDVTTYHDGLFWFDNIDYPLFAETMKVYIGGYRIPMSAVIDIGGHNVFQIDGYKAGDRITIYTEANDTYCYDYINSDQCINDELKANPVFRNYMVSKAK